MRRDFSVGSATFANCTRRVIHVLESVQTGFRRGNTAVNFVTTKTEEARTKVDTTTNHALEVRYAVPSVQPRSQIASVIRLKNNEIPMKDI